MLYRLQEEESSEEESEFEAEPEAFEESSSSVDDEGSDFDGSDASEDEGSASDFGGEDSEGKMRFLLWLYCLLTRQPVRQGTIGTNWSGKQPSRTTSERRTARLQVDLTRNLIAQRRKNLPLPPPNPMGRSLRL